MYPSSIVPGPFTLASVSAALLAPLWYCGLPRTELGDSKLDALSANLGDITEGAFLGEFLPWFHASTLTPSALAMISLLALLFVALAYIAACEVRRRWRRVEAAPTGIVGNLEVTSLKCTHLIDVTDGKQVLSCDPYVELCFGGKKMVTPVHKNEKSPSFSQDELRRLRFPVDIRDAQKHEQSALTLQVFAAKAGGAGLFGLWRKPRSMGYADINIAEVFTAKHDVEVTKSVGLTVDREHEKGGDLVWHERKGNITVSGVYRPTVPKAKK